MAEQPGQQLFDLWRKQVEEGTQAWLKLVGQAPAAPASSPLDPQAFWKPFMDQGIAAWSKVMTQGTASPDLMGQWKQFLDQWIAAWSKALEQAMGTEAFAKILGKQLDGFLNAQSPAKKAAEQQMEATLSGLGVPSRSQVVGLAQQIVQLEEKVEGIEDRVDAVLKRLEEIAAALKR
jgi:polyhydroxyalkanoate synthesis regulator phasin